MDLDASSKVELETNIRASIREEDEAPKHRGIKRTQTDLHGGMAQ